MSLNDFQRTDAVGPDVMFALPQAASQTYAPTQTPPKKVVIQTLALSRLPGAGCHAQDGMEHGSGADAALV